MVFDHSEFDNHEQVVFCHEAVTGLRGSIGIHSTALGPAAGGCRMYPYASDDDALTDVLRLSRGMSYKNAVAGLPLGGGKTVVVADPATEAKQDLLRAMAGFVQELGGRYWTSIDVGAPCALGAVLNDATVPEIRARAVCGLANNQLAEPHDGLALHERGITYVPDYVVNAGGMIGASGAILGPQDHEDALRRIDELETTIGEILSEAAS